MEKLFYTMEVVSGVVCLVLALFLHFSKVPEGEMCKRNKRGRVYIEVAYVFLGIASLIVAGIDSGQISSMEYMKTFFIQGIAPLQVLLFAWAFIYPISASKQIRRFMQKQFAFTLLLFIANLIYYFSLGGKPYTWSAYVLLGCYIVLATVYIRIFMRVSKRWLTRHPDRESIMRKDVYPLWTGICVLAGLGVGICLYPDVILQFVFTAIYTAFYVMLALQYHNYAISNFQYPKENVTLKPTKEIYSSEEKPIIQLTIDSDTMDSQKLKYEKIDEKLARWKADKKFLHAGVTIQDLSKEIGINRTYLSNFINETYHTNFNTWINGLRIDEAKHRIIMSPEASLAEIAEQVGFADLAHFSKQFKLKEGISPSSYRKELKELKEAAAG